MRWPRCRAGATPCRDADCFDAGERAILRLADEVIAGTGASEGALTELNRRGFDDAGLVELVLTARFSVCVSRFLKAMGIVPEAGYDPHLPAL